MESPATNTSNAPPATSAGIPPKSREVGDEAVWSLSSAKPGNGVHQLRDHNYETYWQSDGPQPHTISIQFHKKTVISHVALYLDFKLDESYTPSKVSIRTGTTFHDLREISSVDLLHGHNDTQMLNGWVYIPLHRSFENQAVCKSLPLKTFFLQVAITAMHQNGRDTHVRQVKVFSPSSSTSAGGGGIPHHLMALGGTTTANEDEENEDDNHHLDSTTNFEPTTIEFAKFASLR